MSEQQLPLPFDDVDMSDKPSKWKCPSCGCWVWERIKKYCDPCKDKAKEEYDRRVKALMDLSADDPPYQR